MNLHPTLAELFDRFTDLRLRGPLITPSTSTENGTRLSKRYSIALKHRRALIPWHECAMTICKHASKIESMIIY